MHRLFCRLHFCYDPSFYIIAGPLLFSDKTKFGIAESEPALVVTIATYYGEKPDSLGLMVNH